METSAAASGWEQVKAEPLGFVLPLELSKPNWIFSFLFFTVDLGLCKHLPCAVLVTTATATGRAMRSSDQTFHAEEERRVDVTDSYGKAWP